MSFASGGGAHAHWWTHVAATFARDLRVVALDLSGHGDSGHRDEYDIELWASEVMAVLALATYRTGELDPRTPFGDEILALARFGRHIPLVGLGVGELRNLAGSVTDGADGVDPAVLHRVTGGNPLFARELVRLLDAQGSLGDLARGGAPPVPSTVHGVLARRLRRLTPDCLTVLAIGAVIGEEFDLRVVEMVTGIER